MQAQIDSAGVEIGRQVEAWRTELAELDTAASVDALGSRLKQLEKGLEFGGM